MTTVKLADKLLIDAYKQLRVNITKEPTKKNDLIIQYMDAVDNYTKNNLLVTNEFDNEEQMKSLLKSPLEINIYNNYKKGDDERNDTKSALQSKLDIQNVLSKYNLK
jgi:hypothetical protein